MNLDPQCAHLVGEREEHRASREIARITGPTVTVRAEEPLVQSAVRPTCEGAAPFDELEHRGGCFTGHYLDRAGIAEIVALDDCVGKVVLPAILRVNGPKGGIDPARGQDCMGVLAQSLGDDDDFAANGVDGDGGAQAGCAGAHNEHVGHPGPMGPALHG